MQGEVASGALHPMQAKKNLAWAITRDFHSAEAADAAAENWARQFQQRSVSEDVPIAKVSRSSVLAPSTADMGTVVKIPALLVSSGLAGSIAEANRKLAENAVSLNGQRFSGRLSREDAMGKSPVLRLGKKSVRVEWVE
jgi:tyrosyl-tRNA synthetase